MEGAEEFRFISTNMPDVLQIITDKRFEANSRIRLPSEYELRDAVETVKQMHGRVMRTFVITVTNGSDPNYMVKVAAGENGIAFNEEAMQVLDKLLQICNELGVRVYIPLVNYNDGIRGGTNTYGDSFYTVGSDANVKFKAMVEGLLNRTNTYTGVPYNEDKAILGWESGNELVIGYEPERIEWLHDLAAYVKGLAPYQLFVDGRNKPDDLYKFSGGTMVESYDEFLDDPNIDVISYHTYVGLTGPVTDSSLPANIRTTSSGDIGATNTLKIIRELTKEKMPLVVGEIAMYMAPSTLVTFLDELIVNGTTGANWWATRFHNRDGGFYKHSDNGSQHEDVNWPGFPATTSYLPEIEAEIAIQTTLQDKAWKIMGNSDAPPALPVPAAPKLLAISDVGHISWQGSTGAQSYEVERSDTAEGPWTVVGTVYDNLPTYSSLFHDRDAQPGHTYYYRVIAINSSGASAPSNVSSPVTVTGQWIVDELFDLSKTYNREPNGTIYKSYANTSNQEDLGVLKSIDGTSTSVEYALSGKLRKAAVYAYDAPGSVSLYGSNDGQVYKKLDTQTQTFEGVARTKYSYSGISDYRYLKLELNGTVTVGRVEMEYEADNVPAPEPKSVNPYRNPNMILESELFIYNESDFGSSDVVTNNRGVVKVNQTGGSSSAASNKRFSIVDFLQTGDYAVFFAEIEAGTYNMQLDYDARSARGAFQLAILEPGAAVSDVGNLIGDVVDAYDPGSGVIKSVDYGTITFPETGRYGFKFVSTGKNAASSNPKIGLDVIKLLSNNVAPSATDATYSTNDATPVSGTLQASDANGDSLTYTVIHHPAEGQLVVNVDGTFTYTPARGNTGVFTFKWKVNDGWINSNTAQVSFHVASSSNGYTGDGNIHDPDSGAALKETVDTSNGRIVVSATIDYESFARLLEQAGRQGDIALKVFNPGDIVKLELNGDVLETLKNRQNVVSIETAAGTYRLPVHELDWSSIAGQLGGSLNLTAVISLATEEEAASAGEQAELQGARLVASPVSFELTLSNGNQDVTIDHFLSYVERSIPLPNGVKGQIVTGVIIREDGTLLHVPTHLTKENGEAKAVISSMTNSTYAVVAGGIKFDDISNHWGAADIRELGSRMIVKGNPEGGFKPDRAVTRAEFAAMLNRTLGLGSKLEVGTFRDVREQDWYANELGTAQRYGLIEGYQDGTFKPDKAITREEAMVAIAAAASFAGLNTQISDSEADSQLLSFNDGGEVSTWAKLSAAALVKLSLIEGRSGSLDPKEPITRAEAVALMARLLRSTNLI